MKTPSNERRRALFAGTVILVLAVVAAALFRPGGGPRHQGRSLSAWINDLDPRKPQEVRLRAAEAIRAIGPAALPHLENELKDFARQRNFAENLFRRVHGGYDADYRRHDCNLRAVEVLGTEARPMVPALREMLKSRDHITRIAAANALGAIGPAAEEALPELVTCVLTEYHGAFFAARDALVRIGSPAREYLQRATADADRKQRETASNVIRWIDHSPQNARPATRATSAP